MYIALLGRQPELSMAELERVFHDVMWFSAETALVRTAHPIDIQRLGGSQKIGTVSAQLSTTNWQHAAKEVLSYYESQWRAFSGKLTLGISAYDFSVSARDVQKLGLTLKSSLRRHGVSVRLVPNTDAALSTATSHHNKLGLAENKVELLIVRGASGTIIAESTGAQNITALAARDQGRPRRDAFVGMLPPKLAQMMINMATGGHEMSATGSTPRLLDPFCGTGVLLQEALLLGYPVYGTDLSEKMIRFTNDNLTWLTTSHHMHVNNNGVPLLAEGDAMTYQWQKPIGAVVSEAYLGQPFSAPPSPAKLADVQKNCNYIIESFLNNISAQLAPGTPVVLAVPSWRGKNGELTHLPLTTHVEKYGFTRTPLATVDTSRLMYARPDQVVARELLLLEKK